jgi:hypothetical protein
MTSPKSPLLRLPAADLARLRREIETGRKVPSLKELLAMVDAIAEAKTAMAAYAKALHTALQTGGMF